MLGYDNTRTCENVLSFYTFRIYFLRFVKKLRARIESCHRNRFTHVRVFKRLTGYDSIS